MGNQNSIYNMNHKDEVDLMHQEFYDTYYNIYKEMDEQEFIELIKKAQAGDLEARDTIWVNNLAMIKTIARRYTKLSALVDFDDLIQEGALAVYESIMRFDVSLSYQFSTYLYAAIRSFMLRYLQKNDVFKTPAYIYAGTLAYKKITTKYPEYTEQQIYDKMRESKQFKDLTFNNFVNIKMYADLKLLSLYSTTVNNGEESDALIDSIASTRNEEEEILNYMVLNNIFNCMDELSEKQRDVLLKRIGYETGDPMTLEEIAQEYGCTREYIRVTELEARLKLAPALVKFRQAYGLSDYDPKVEQWREKKELNRKKTYEKKKAKAASKKES